MILIALYVDIAVPTRGVGENARCVTGNFLTDVYMFRSHRNRRIPGDVSVRTSHFYIILSIRSLLQKDSDVRAKVSRSVGRDVPHGMKQAMICEVFFDEILHASLTCLISCLHQAIQCWRISTRLCGRINQPHLVVDKAINVVVIIHRRNIEGCITADHETWPVDYCMAMIKGKAATLRRYFPRVLYRDNAGDEEDRYEHNRSTRR